MVDADPRIYFFRSAALYVLGFAAVVHEESIPSAEREIARRHMQNSKPPYMQDSKTTI